MGIKCCIKTCFNTLDKNPYISLHRFPRKDTLQYNKWLQAIPPDLITLQRNIYICCMHFCENSFQPPTPTGKNILKKDAIPSIFYSGSEDARVENNKFDNFTREAEKTMSQGQIYETTIKRASVANQVSPKKQRIEKNMQLQRKVHILQQRLRRRQLTITAMRNRIDTLKTNNMHNSDLEQVEGHSRFSAKMTVPPDTYQISLNIIEAIKQHPVLYCTEVKGLPVKLQEFKQKVWKRIADELGLDATWVRLKWKNLRDTYCRILKYKNKTEEGARRKKWIFEDYLNFVKFPYEPDYQPQCIELTKEYIDGINSGEVTSEGLLEQLEDRNEDYTEYLEVLEETSADPVILVPETIETLDNSDPQLVIQDTTSEQDVTQQDLDSYVHQIQSKYRKIRPKRMKIGPSTSKASNSNRIKKKSSLQSNNVSALDASTVANPVVATKSLAPGTSPSPVKGQSGAKNSDAGAEKVYLAPESKSIELFFDSMAQTVKKLPPKAQADIKMHICKLVTEAEVRYSGQSMPQSTQQFIAPPGMIPKLVLIPCNMIDNQNAKN